MSHEPRISRRCLDFADLETKGASNPVRFPMRKALQLVPMIAFSLVFCAAQTATDQAPEPDAIGVFFYLDPATQTLKRLPTEQFNRHSGGLRSTTQHVRALGRTSSFR